jgi:hypothetical protein
MVSLPFDPVKEQPLKRSALYWFKAGANRSIVGSLGRYRDFDRAFCRSRRGRKPLISIDRFHYEEIELPLRRVIQDGRSLLC